MVFPHLSQVHHLGNGGVCLCRAHQAGVNGVPDNPSLGVQQDGLHMMWLRLEAAPLPRPKGSVRSATCFPLGMEVMGWVAFATVPFQAPELQGPGPWALLSPGRSCGLAVISHMLSSIDILPPYTQAHACSCMYTHAYNTHTSSSQQVTPSLALPGTFLTAALVLLGRRGLTWVV